MTSENSCVKNKIRLVQNESIHVNEFSLNQMRFNHTLYKQQCRKRVEEVYVFSDIIQLTFTYFYTKYLKC